MAMYFYSGRRKFARLGRNIADFIFCFCLTALNHTLRWLLELLWDGLYLIASAVQKFIDYLRDHRTYHESRESNRQTVVGDPHLVRDTVCGLKNLGFPKQLATYLVTQTMEQGGPYKSVEELLRESLRRTSLLPKSQSRPLER